MMSRRSLKTFNQANAALFWLLENNHKNMIYMSGNTESKEWHINYMTDFFARNEIKFESKNGSKFNSINNNTIEFKTINEVRKMTRLKDFLKKVNGKETDIITYKGAEALSEVKKDGYTLRFVKEQTEAICLEAVKQNGDALRFVNETIFEEEVEEMTLEQICKLLNKTIKIVK